MRALNRKLIRDLLQMRTQIIAVALVVMIGIAVFVGLRSVYDSLLVTQSTYYNSYRFADVFAQLVRAPESVARRIEALPGVAAVQTRVVADVTLDVPGLRDPAMGRFVSAPEREAALNDLYLRRGRMLTPGEPDEVMVSEAFADANELEVGDSVGAVLNGRWRRLGIVGVALSPEYVYEIRGAGEVFPDNRRFGVFWMEREALAAAFDLEGAFNDVVASLGPRADTAEVLLQMDDILERYGGLGAIDREDQISHRFLSDEIAQNRVTSVMVPAIFMGVAAFLINVLLGRLVGTQREQIAVLKAFGYTDLSVGLHYLGFAVSAMLIGAVLGIGIGLWLGSAMTGVYAEFYRFPVIRYVPSPLVILLALVINGGAALIGALAAVRRAVRLPPAEAMQPEPPAQFRAGILETLHIQRLFSPAVRIIVRNLERRPLRATLSMVGIAMAVAILVVGRFFGDAINYIADLQFRVVQREDVAVTFENTRPMRALHELDRLPGVLRAEPVRMVPVDMRHGHLNHRVAILGLRTDGQLRRLIDQVDERPVGLPPTGLVLTSQLADMINAPPGSTVAVEILEEDRAVRMVPVVGTVDEVVGLSAYMSLGAVSRLLHEQPAVSGAYLTIDPLLRDSLYATLQALPAVAGVSLREATLQSFEETIAQSTAISTTVLIIFSVVIAFGVVYNSARIALSERGRELATLRVLGFFRSEVARILLGEQAMLTLAAMPVGFLLGYGAAALITQAAASETFRFPLVVSRGTYAFAFVVVSLAALASGWLVRRRLNRIDLIEVLKTRE